MLKRGSKPREEPESPPKQEAPLRRKAEKLLEDKDGSLHKAVSETDLRALVHELQVHQIELGQQNEELVSMKEVLEESEQKFRDLFDFAPIGYVTLEADGTIDELNLAGAAALGTSRSDIVRKRFQQFIEPKCIPEFSGFCARVLASRVKQSCEIRVMNSGDRPRTVLFEARVADDEAGDPKTFMAAFVDITDKLHTTAELLRTNRELRESRENLTVVQDELRKQLEVLSRKEQALRENEKRLEDALDEKEVLLAEIHHRVKNNLTAFISLLSLEGNGAVSLQEKNLKTDLQNRARSMALIHETLYRTEKYSTIDMEVYVRTLVEQIALSYSVARPPQIQVDAAGVVIDIDRATSCGLIINEIVTNSYKHAFPGGFDCTEVRREPCRISITITQDDAFRTMKVSDNGIGDRSPGHTVPRPEAGQLPGKAPVTRNGRGEYSSRHGICHPVCNAGSRDPERRPHRHG